MEGLIAYMMEYSPDDIKKGKRDKDDKLRNPLSAENVQQDQKENTSRDQ